MNQKEGFVILIICGITFFTIIPFVFAEEFIMELNTTINTKGKNIHFIGVDADKANFKVDGVFGSVAKNTTDTINGVDIFLIALSKSPAKVIIDVTIDYVCGDGSCSSSEDNQICCTDCGCLGTEYVCQSNVCVKNITTSSNPEGPKGCFDASDCDDQNVCTQDSCDMSYVPARCKYVPITQCVNDDHCCPKGCGDNNDNDCEAVDLCALDTECEDNNPCTTRACTGDPKRCATLSVNDGCSVDGVCAAAGTISKGTFCSSTYVLVRQKVDSSPCEYDYECQSGSCSFSECGKNDFLQKYSYLFFIIVMIAAILILITYFALNSQTKKPPQQENKEVSP